jgi:hypothetical protein
MSSQWRQILVLGPDSLVADRYELDDYGRHINRFGRDKRRLLKAIGLVRPQISRAQEKSAPSKARVRLPPLSITGPLLPFTPDDSMRDRDGLADLLSINFLMSSRGNTA